MCNEYLKAFHKTNGNSTEIRQRSSCSHKVMTGTDWMPEVKSMESILVHTGVSLQDGDNPTKNEGSRFLHRDTVFQHHLRRADHVVHNIAGAVELILRKEQEGP